MIGDKLIINDYHIVAADYVMEQIKKTEPDIPFSIAVSGESGSGKSEIAQLLKERFEEQGKKVIVLGQDDYFKLPPHSNHEHRMKVISWVGPGEVKLTLLNNHVKKLQEPVNEELIKPLVHFENDSIGTEVVSGPYDVVIAEGTYTALLEDVDIRVFIDRDYKETKKHRLSRNRDQSLEDNNDQNLTFLEEVLEIEHNIIKEHKKKSDVIIPSPDVLLS